MAKTKTVRLPDGLAASVEAAARVQGTSFNALTVQALAAAVAELDADPEFTAAAQRLLARDRDIYERLAQQ